MFRRKLIVVEANLEGLAKILYTFERVALREGITAFIDVKPILERDSGSYELRPKIDRFRIWVPGRLYRKVVERVEKVDVVQYIVDGGYADV